MNEATYCPEDNKLRLYVGRVPREEFLALRAEGWTCTPKQREAGGCDFVATWSPQRKATALKYGEGVILDEDQSPEERAADRAERFGGYRDKRLTEAGARADAYDSQPTAHGFQSEARAERAARRHDRIADHAVDAWEKAEYWTDRTAGVIAHALYKSRPDVRMGRIKELEADLRKVEKSLSEWASFYNSIKKLAAMTDADAQTILVRRFFDCTSYHLHDSEFKHPRPETVTNPRIKEHGTSLGSLLSMVRWEYGTDDITGAEACAMFLAKYKEPSTETEWTRHLKHRLAYENQMLEAQGGRAGVVEMVEGGRIGRHLVVKVCKSNVTGRTTSVWVKGQKIQGWTYQAKDVPGAPYSLHQVETERLPADAYTPPTEKDIEELLQHKAEVAKQKAKVPTVPLINPTEEDAAKLQAIWNSKEKTGSEVLKLTQAQYSALSGGTYSACETVVVCEMGTEHLSRYGQNITRHSLFKVRKKRAGDYNSADRVIVITDKPQKALPWSRLEAARAKEPTCESLRPRLEELAAACRKGWKSDLTPDQEKLFQDARYVGLAYYDSESQFGLTDAGKQALREYQPVTA